MKLNIIKTCKLICLNKKFIFMTIIQVFLLLGFYILISEIIKYFDLYTNFLAVITGLTGTILSWSIGLGFLSVFAHNEIHSISPLYPDFKNNIVKYLTIGFKCLIAIFIYNCAGILLIKLSSFIFVKLSTVLFKNLFYWSIDNLFSINFIPLMDLILGFSRLLGFTFLCFFMVIGSIVFTAFSNNFKFKDSFNFSLIFKIIIQNKLSILKLMIISLIIAAISQFLYLFVISEILSLVIESNIIIDLILLSLQVTFSAMTFIIIINLFAQIFKNYKVNEIEG